MIPSTTTSTTTTTNIDLPVATVVDPQASEGNRRRLLIITDYFLILFRYLRRIFTLAALAIAAHVGLLTFLVERVVMPHSALGFITNALLAFVEIKSQGQPQFPFETHPHLISLSVISLLMYGVASAAELVVFDRASVYATIARFGRMACLCVLIVLLSSLFCV